MKYFYQFKANGHLCGLATGVNAPVSVDGRYIVERDEPLPETARYLDGGMIYHTKFVETGEEDGEPVFEEVIDDSKEPIEC